MLQTIRKGQTNDLVKAAQYMIDTAARRTAIAPMQSIAGATSPTAKPVPSAALIRGLTPPKTPTICKFATAIIHCNHFFDKLMPG